MRGLRHWWLLAALMGLLAVVMSLAACDSSSVKAVAVPTATGGDVTIVVDRPSYGVTEPIGITITNAGKTDVYAVAGHSGCTFLQLEEYNATNHSWIPVSGCQTAEQPQTLLIPGKQHNNNTAFNEAFTLAPGNSPTNANAWDVGLYRITLTFSADAALSKNTQTVYSAGFRVAAAS